MKQKAFFIVFEMLPYDKIFKNSGHKFSVIYITSLTIYLCSYEVSEFNGRLQIFNDEKIWKLNGKF